MNLDSYRLLAQLGAGSDGVSYRALVLRDGSPAEVRILSSAGTDTERRHRLSKRLRLANMLEHAVAIGIRELGLEHSPPYIALEWIDGQSLGEELGDRVPLQKEDALALVYELASAVTAAHRLGLAHGRLCPGQIYRGTGQVLKIDFTGTDTVSHAVKGSELDASCLAPEQVPDEPPTLPQDIYSLGALIYWLLEGQPFVASRDPRNVPESLRQTRRDVPGAASDAGSLPDQLIPSMLAKDPVERPTITEVTTALAGLCSVPEATGVFVPANDPLVCDRTIAGDRSNRTVLSVDEALARERLGRFRLLNKLGQGGMGAVYRAQDLTDGSCVAIKVLRRDWAQQPLALRRFHKEARLLAEVNNPHVANLLEVNEDDGIHYLVLEFVEGQSLGKLLGSRGRLNEALALRLMADVARALVDAHARGIVHRDIKPDNILIIDSAPAPATGAKQPGDYPRVKLTDFGLARHVVESDSLSMTQTGTMLGTPSYMSPEQCTGSASVAPPTDIYAMGATLFHLLAGRPPFVGDTPLSIISMQCNEAPPALQSLNPAISDGICQIVDRCLAKSPEARYANAAALLHDLERVIRGEPTSMVAHPRLPTCDPAKVLHYDWTWSLEASPEQLWPHVSNTERLNKAAGLPAVQFTTQTEPGRGVRRFGKFRKVGVTAAWQEHPFEWIEARRMGVLRQYSQGPFKWMVSVVELAPRASGGSTLTHRVRIEPTGIVGRTVAAVEVGRKGRRAVDRIYRRIDAALTGKLGGQGLADPFEEPAWLSGRARRRLEGLLERLHACGVDPAVVERFGDFLALAPAQEVARIRPLALARRLALDPAQVVAACLYGSREGLLVLLWDILCPVCRIPSEVKETLKALRDHGRCQACNLDFELDFGNSVEMIFRAHPQIRHTELGTYCIGGPAHSPHVVAQVRVGPSERIELDLALPEGAYRFRGPQLPFTLDFRVQPAATATRWELNLARGPDPELPRVLRAGRLLLALTNDYPQELVARLERTAPREDALTAARASALALFRELFPAEILSPGQLVSVANVVLLATDLEGAGALYHDLGDARAFGLIHEHFRLLDERIRREGGALVKTVGEGVLASFSDSVTAVRTGLELPAVLAGNEATRNLRLRIGVHRGPAMAATLNDHLDYFGTTVNVAAQLPRFARGGELVLTGAIAADPQVAALLASLKLQCEIVDVPLPGEPGSLLHRVVNVAASAPMGQEHPRSF